MLEISVTSTEPVTGQPSITRRWLFDSRESVNNLVDARLELPFDPTRASVPIQSSILKVENGVNYAEGLPPVADYDFTDPDNMRALGFPTTLSAELGFVYADDTSELVPSFYHSLVDAVVDDYDTYLTLTGESFLSQLDKGLFYGGRYASTGIDGVTLLTEILEDVVFRGEGGWNYILGSPSCVTSTTVPLWADSGFEYWVIDEELARLKVYLPIPVVSHRQAIQMVASYLGADVWTNRQGQIVISRGLYAGAPPDYTLDVDRVYDRPKRIRPTAIGAMDGKLYQYTYEAAASEIASISVVVPSADIGETKAYRITHDGCHASSLALTGATLVGSPTYYTYSTEFLASTSNQSFTATLTGKKVDLKAQTMRVTFVEGGVTATYENPIASDATYLQAAMREYVRMATAPQYEISMRDDPAIDNGDRLVLEQSTAREYAVPDATAPTSGVTETHVVVGNITREFSGSLNATYLLYENENRYIEDFSSLDDSESIIGYDGWVGSNATKTTIDNTPMVSVSSSDGASAMKTVDLRVGSPLKLSVLIDEL